MLSVFEVVRRTGRFPQLVDVCGVRSAFARFAGYGETSRHSALNSRARRRMAPQAGFAPATLRLTGPFSRERAAPPSPPTRLPESRLEVAGERRGVRRHVHRPRRRARCADRLLRRAARHSAAMADTER